MQLEMQSGRTTLDNFYGPDGYLVTQQRFDAGAASAMCKLIAQLRITHKSYAAFGITHMHQLALTADDRGGAQEYVRITAQDEHVYWIEYLLPSRLSPWPDAWVRGLGTSPEEAVEMVPTAIERSEGWLKDNGG